MRRRKRVRLNIYVRIAMIVMAMVIAISAGISLVLASSDKEVSEKLDSQVTVEELKEASEDNAENEEESSAIELTEEIQVEGKNKYIVKNLQEEGRLDGDGYEEDEEDESDIEMPESDYILPNSDTVYLQDSDLEGLSATELRIARNEIMARHGRIFRVEDLREYFENKSWYHPTVSGDEFDAHTDEYLSEIELSNINKIMSYE